MDIPRILPEEVLAHNREGDVWVSVLGQVMNVSDLASPTGPLASRIIFSYAGKDMSHFFDEETLDARSHVHPASGERVRLVLGMLGDPTWWRDPSRQKGTLTRRPRPIRVLDTFSGLQVLLSVCAEDTVARILERYAPYNSDVGRYRCVYEGRPVDAAKTLDENGVADERDVFLDVGLPEDFFVPALLLVRDV